MFLGGRRVIQTKNQKILGSATEYEGRTIEMRTQLTIGTKVMASVVTLLVLALVIGSAGLIIIGKFQLKFDDAMNRTVRKVVLADTINTAASDMVSAQRLVIIGAALKNNEIDAGSRAFRDGLNS